MEERTVVQTNLISFPAQKESPALEELLQDTEVADFYRFVYENNLRLRAIELLEKRIGGE